ncbi:SagB/ThcOx family dehydrogenase [Chitinivibrio alkaliphilus]|uniref:Nitroreductase n=1 Tax=Chitinivibrio alkaliphilus ACht1 TaxID=1313304 RepID=U7D6Q1_9BACT|nr:SagB/ThcOx family dehydrogenase [Chitinivibrio alkaliphilus]ERP32194.1 nitroreductase [Chitinivibrio alkaliphilus ACht1]
MLKQTTIFILFFVFFIQATYPTQALPTRDSTAESALEQTIRKRRSHRTFTNTALSEEEISRILFAGQGITEDTHGFRTAPSAGATYPLSLYVFTEEGVFLYVPTEHHLKKISSEDSREMLSQAALGQDFIAEAGATFLFSAIPQRTTNRYGSRGMQYIYMECGHAAQNMLLQATDLGLSGVPVGAFTEEALRPLLYHPDEEVPLYIISIGRER